MLKLFECVVNWLIHETSVYIKGITLPFLIGGIYKLTLNLFKKVSDKKDQKSLFPYYNKSLIQDAKKNYIRTKCQNIDPANEINYKSSFAFSTREDLLNFYLKKVFKIEDNETQFYLILGDSGMGKTTFMLNLFSKYTSYKYFNFRKRKIKLLPLGEGLDTIYSVINKITVPAETILLLDGFDELPSMNGSNIMPKFNELIDKTKQFRIVIITCRTHFFSSEKDEPYELKIKKYNTDGNGFHIIKKMYISPFDDKDIKTYINRVYSPFEFSKKNKAHQIVNNTNDLMVRPMLLSYIKEIVNCNDGSLSSTFDIYESLILSWLEREANKYESTLRNDFKLNLMYFTYAIVDFIYENYESNGLFIPLEDAIRISNLFKINLNEIEIKSRSLLNRNSLGDYKFSHKSFFEFFIALLAFVEREYKFDVYTIKYDLRNFDFAKLFLQDILFTNKVSFRLPIINRVEPGYNVELYKKILLAKSKGSKTTINWISDKSFKVENM